MKKYLFYLSMALVAVVLFSCKSGKKSVFTPTSSGRAYEVLVVVEKPVWERPAGRALYNVLDTDVPGLPQSERSFRIMSTSPKDFDAILKLVRNIIIVDIQDIYTQPKFKYAKDVYASPQMILTIQAPDEASFEKFVEENKQPIIDFFTRAEMNRQISFLEKNHNDYISTKVGSMFNSDIWLPAELSSSKTGEDFFWAGTNAATGDQNFVIYSYPYTDKDTFTKEFFIHKRDSVMKANIPGAKEGMYMAKSGKGLVRNAFFKIEAMRFQAYQKVAQYANLIIAVSTTDADYLRKQFPNQRIEFVPCFHENNRITAKPGKSDYILYHGKLSVIENERAVLFLTKHVFSQLKHTCIIAGMNPTRLIREAAAPYPHIKVEANPSKERMDALIHNAQIHMLITFQDTGLKLKLLNSLFAGRHTIVNHLMLAGSGLDPLCHIADTPDEMIRACEQLMALPIDKEAIDKRKQLLFPAFSNEDQGIRLYKMIYDERE